MIMKKLLFLLPLLSISLLIGCTPSGGQSSGKTSSESYFEGEITVNFYVDYNQKIVGNVYYSTTMENGNLITDKPEDPTEPLYPEFPVFKGWSYKEIIGSDEDLWDFSTNVVKSKNNTFDLFGIWVAEGE